ncbi:MAG: hypothetical protein Q4Q58_02110 [Thermoplasmata archaeon]|nr:hypothetical protein [Thermoplasmata archaeon]
MNFESNPRRAVAFSAALLMAFCAVLCVGIPATEGSTASDVTPVDTESTVAEPGTYVLLGASWATFDLTEGSMTVYMLDGSSAFVTGSSDSGNTLTMYLATSLSGTGGEYSVEYIDDSDLILTGSTDGSYVTAHIDDAGSAHYDGHGVLTKPSEGNRAAYAADSDGTTWVYYPLSYTGVVTLAYDGFNTLTLESGVAYTMDITLGSAASVSLTSFVPDDDAVFEAFQDSASVTALLWEGKMMMTGGKAVYEGFQTFSSEIFSGAVAVSSDDTYIGTGDMGTYTVDKTSVNGVYGAEGVSMTLVVNYEQMTMTDVASAGDDDTLLITFRNGALHLTGGYTGTIVSSLSTARYEGTVDVLRIVDDGDIAIEKGSSLTVTGSISLETSSLALGEGSSITFGQGTVTTIPVWTSHGDILQMDSVVSTGFTITDGYRTPTFSGRYLSGTITTDSIQGVNIEAGSVVYNLILPGASINFVSGGTLETYMLGNVVCGEMNIGYTDDTTGVYFTGDSVSVSGILRMVDNHPAVFSRDTTVEVGGDFYLIGTKATILGEFTVDGVIVTDDLSQILHRNEDCDEIHISNIEDVMLLQCTVTASDWSYVLFSKQLGVANFELYGTHHITSDFTLEADERMTAVSADVIVDEGVTFTNYGYFGSTEMGDDYRVLLEEGASFLNYGTASIYGSMLTVSEGATFENRGLLQIEFGMTVLGTFVSDSSIEILGGTMSIGSDGVNVKARVHGDVSMVDGTIAVASGSQLLNYGTIAPGEGDTGSKVTGDGELRNMNGGTVTGVSVESAYSDGSYGTSELVGIAVAAVVIVLALVAIVLVRRD